MLGVFELQQIATYWSGANPGPIEREPGVGLPVVVVAMVWGCFLIAGCCEREAGLGSSWSRSREESRDRDDKMGGQAPGRQVPQ